MSFAIDAAKELGIRVIAFRTFSACCLWSYFCLPNLVQEGQLPVNGECKCTRLDLLHKCFFFFFFSLLCVSRNCNRRRYGFDGRRRAGNGGPFATPRSTRNLQKTTRRSHLSIIRCGDHDNLESPVLSHLAPLFSKIYTIGPLNALMSIHSRSNVWLF
jgi:hypothetical protein